MDDISEHWGRIFVNVFVCSFIVIKKKVYIDSEKYIF